MKVYADHAATTPMDKRVFAAMRPHFTTLYANPSSSHFFGRQTCQALDEARDGIASLLGVKPLEIYFTSSGSEADNMAIKGVAHALGKDCKQILLSSIEHHAMLHSAERLRQEGFTVNYIPVLSNGIVDLTALQELLKTPTSLVCVMGVNNEVGTVQPIKEVASLAHAANALCFSDCVQAAPYFNLTVADSGVDLLSVSAHKLNGPKGVGMLYAKRGTPLQPLIDGGEQERGLRGGTSFVAGAVGLYTALRLATLEREQNVAEVQAVRDHFIELVEEQIDCAHLNGDRLLRSPCNANFSFTGVDGTALLHRLDLCGIAASAGSACASGAIEPSHVLTAMGLPPEQLTSAVRFTFGKGNTLQQAEYIVKKLKLAVKDLKP